MRSKCRLHALQLFTARHSQAAPRIRVFHTTILLHQNPSHSESEVTPSNQQPKGKQNTIDVEEILSKPTWSVSDLLPSSSNEAQPEITPSQLHHLLRLSALPPPSSKEEESNMLRTLSNQLHFVRQIQQVDTTNVEPLRALRDETSAGDREREITMDSLRDAFEKEEEVGEFWRRPVRRKAAAGKTTSDSKDQEDVKKWDPLENASRKVGRYFVVDKGLKKEE